MKIEFVFGLNVDFHSKHSLSAGGPGSSLALFAPVGSPSASLFPQESRTFHSNQLNSGQTQGKSSLAAVFLKKNVPVDFRNPLPFRRLSAKPPCRKRLRCLG